jgi:hypothetical protein
LRLCPGRPLASPALHPALSGGAQVHEAIDAELIAIFDADFLPEPDFLLKVTTLLLLLLYYSTTLLLHYYYSPTLLNKLL